MTCGANQTTAEEKGQSSSSRDGANNAITFTAMRHVAGKQNRSRSKYAYLGPPVPTTPNLLQRWLLLPNSNRPVLPMQSSRTFYLAALNLANKVAHPNMKWYKSPWFMHEGEDPHHETKPPSRNRLSSCFINKTTCIPWDCFRHNYGSTAGDRSSACLLAAAP
jgi:hypothetical protein